nr:MAG TPA: hypothetical protein [Caudoviricetes sp.]
MLKYSKILMFYLSFDKLTRLLFYYICKEFTHG